MIVGLADISWCGKLRAMKMPGKAVAGGSLRIGLPIIILIAIGVYCAFPHPTHNRAKLRAIASESQRLMAKYPIGPRGEAVTIREGEWPPAIVGLKPYTVIVFDGSVHIGTRPFFDGGWGYGYAPDRRNLGMLPQCWSELGSGMFWHGPC
ncbi:MAG: hypothetical protein WBL20_21705 [Sphingobium sp.]|uniref:hypothetical protein n=1 Tax=Sphingobium sp. TaxID=1912891 RepID=UPI002E21CEA2